MVQPDHLAAFSSVLARERDKTGLRPRDLQIIAILVSHDTALSVGMVATLLAMSQTQVSRICERLVKLKMIKRRDSPTDRRICLLEPTAEARRVDERVRAHYDAAQSA